MSMNARLAGAFAAAGAILRRDVERGRRPVRTARTGWRRRGGSGGFLTRPAPRRSGGAAKGVAHGRNRAEVQE